MSDRGMSNHGFRLFGGTAHRLGEDKPLAADSATPMQVDIDADSDENHFATDVAITKGTVANMLELVVSWGLTSVPRSPYTDMIVNDIEAVQIGLTEVLSKFGPEDADTKETLVAESLLQKYMQLKNMMTTVAA